MKQIEYYNSKFKYIGFLLICLVFIVIAAFMIISGDEVLMGWLCGGFFLLCACIFLKQIFNNRPRLVITEEGILDNTLGVGRIDWKDIQGMNVRSVSKNDFICLEMEQAANDKYLAKISSTKRKLVSANTALGFTPLNINLSGVKGSTDEIFNVFVEHLERVNPDSSVVSVE